MTEKLHIGEKVDSLHEVMQLIANEKKRLFREENYQWEYWNHVEKRLIELTGYVPF